MRDNDGRKLDHRTLEVLRLRAVEKVRAGAHPEDVATTLGLHRKTGYGWLAKYREGGPDALLEIHHIPKHRSWLNIAEIELSALSRAMPRPPHQRPRHPQRRTHRLATRHQRRASPDPLAVHYPRRTRHTPPLGVLIRIRTFRCRSRRSSARPGSRPSVRRPCRLPGGSSRPEPVPGCPGCRVRGPGGSG